MLNQEKILATLGAFITVFVLASLTQIGSLNYSLNIMLIASMGASTFLVFVTPHSPMAQPWAVIAGNTVSALVGISVLHLVSEPLLAMPLAASLSIADLSPAYLAATSL